jgi:hypothetical protein
LHGYYEGEALVTASFILEPEDYAKARLLVQRHMKPITRPWVRAGMLLTVSLLFLALLPYSMQKYGNIWAPLLLFLLFLSCSLWAGFRLPKLEEGWLRSMYATDRFALLETTVCLYRDTFTAENAYQKFEENWVDFTRCLESREYIVAVGGKNYPLLVMKKEQMTQEQQEKASRCVENYFAGRYKRV